MRRAAVLLAAAGLATIALLAACGGSRSADKDRAKADFGVYAKAEAQRDDAEAALNQAFRDISSSAAARDRVGVMAAVGHGEDAVQTIDSTLAVQIEAANALAGYGPIQEHAGKLRDALRRSRNGAELVSQQLAIARRDPFLDDDANLHEIGRLSAQSVQESVPAALARRRAVRAIAVKLGVEPPVDVMLDLPQTATTGG